MTIEQVTMWKDNAGGLHPTAEHAQTANGGLALREHIVREFGPSPTLTIADVTAYIADWYLIWLEASK